MAGISDKIKTFLDDVLGFGVSDPDEMFRDLDEGEVDYPTESNVALQPIQKPTRNNDRNLKVVPISGKSNYEVVVFEPRAYNESIQIVEALKERKTVILNLQLLDREQSQRIVDFLCGCTHALDGNQRKIGEFVFIFTPSNINLTQEMVNSKLSLDARWNQSQTL